MMRRLPVWKRDRDSTFPRGVLKVKKGYNPNSSSIGTVVYSFPFAYAALSTILAVLAALSGRRRKRDRGDRT